MQRPGQSDKRTNKQPAARKGGRQTAVGPGDRRDGQPLIFGWGGHLTRAQKQRYRTRFVIAAGAFVFLLVALVLGIGALQQYFFKPRFAVATVNGDVVERQWYEKNVAYTQFVLQHNFQDAQNQLKALNANNLANANATATALATSTPPTTPTVTPQATSTAAASTTPAGSPTPANTPTPAPTLNPQQSATASALQQTLAEDQAQFQGVQQTSVRTLIDDQLMRQNASKFGIAVSSDEVAAQAKKTTTQIGGDAVLKDLLNQAHLSQNDFNQIQYNVVLRDKYQAYFATHPAAAPPATPTPRPAAAPTVEGPTLPTPTAQPTPAPTPGADSLERWLADQLKSAKVSRAAFPLPA